MKWGSRDSWLGIPVTWPQISTARAIVETDFTDLQVEPSLGSHFFHNLTCYGVAFFAVHEKTDNGVINWDWLDRLTPASEDLEGAVRHFQLDLDALDPADDRPLAFFARDIIDRHVVLVYNPLNPAC